MRRFTVACVLLMPGLALAQPKDPDLETIHLYVLGGKQSEAEREAAVKKLLDAKPQLANAKDDDGTVLSYALDSIGLTGGAADMGRKAKKLAELLVAKRANVNAVVGRHEKEALLLKYARFAQVEAMEFLVKHGAKTDAKDADGRSALHWVALLGEMDKEKRLVDKSLRAAKILLDGKAAIDARDKRGQTPLGVTAYLGNLKMTELLVSRGADINAKGKDGNSVLAWVKMRGEKTKIGGEEKHRFTNAKERATLPPVIAFLEKKGAKDVRGK